MILPDGDAQNTARSSTAPWSGSATFLMHQGLTDNGCYYVSKYSLKWCATLIACTHSRPSPAVAVPTAMAHGLIALLNGTGGPTPPCS
jgi:hypothetical protein